jgi:LacI family transcriptional regulator
MSLKALAESLGLSKTTVSRALAGYEDVSAETRARVKAAADATGYRPNPTALRLTKGSTDTVAIVVPSVGGERRYEPLFVDLAASIGARLAEEGVDLTLTASRPGEDELAVYRRLVEGKRADAIVLVRTGLHDERVAYLAGRGFPFVCFGRTDADAPYAFVDGDGHGAFRDATRHLIALGHRRFAFLGAPGGSFSTRDRRRGHLAALAEAGLAPGPAFEGPSNEETGAALAREALALTPRPTVLLCGTDRVAIGASLAVRAAGLVPGRDVSIVGHDNLPVTAFTETPLSTMELALADVGEAIAASVLALVKGADPATLGFVLPVTPIWRASVGPPG